MEMLASLKCFVYVFLLAAIASAQYPGFKSRRDLIAARQLLSDDGVDLGPISSIIRIGEMPPKYQKQSRSDIKATKKFDRVLHNMVGTYTLPPLDPYEKTYKVNVLNMELTGSLFLKEMVVTGIAHVLDALELRLGYDDKYRFDLNLTLPEFTVDVKFDGAVKLPYYSEYVRPFVSRGAARVTLYNLRVKAAFAGSPLSPPKNSTGSLNSLLHVDSLEAFVAASNVVLKLDTDLLILKLIEKFVPVRRFVYTLFGMDFGQAIGQFVLQLTNKVLAGIPYVQAKALFMV